MFKERQKRKRCIIILTVLLLVAGMGVTCMLYLRDYYRTDYNQVQAFAPMHQTTKQTLTDETIVFKPNGATKETKGLIFYPGGKVEYTAYEPLMAACAEQGILCVLIKMPFQLAVLNPNAADGIQEKYPEIESWYIGGHSLGGAMAASYLAKHTEEYAGLVLLGAYATKDLSNANLRVLSIYGSEDKVLNLKKYETYKSNLPDDFTEVVLSGGCHSYFGMYGMQDGDGTPSITNEEQIYKTAQYIGDVLK